MPTAPPFIIGVWQADPLQFAQWRELGVNALFGHVDYGGRLPKDAWEARAAAAELWYADYPGADAAAEAKQPYRLGFLQKDEPDLSSHVDRPGYTPAEFKAIYDRCRATGLPVFETLCALDNQWYDGNPKPYKSDGSKYGHRADAGGWMAYADVLMDDYYTLLNGKGLAADLKRRIWDRFHGWSGGKPRLVVVEPCTQGKDVPITPDDLEAQVMHAVAYAALRGHRIAGICYFTHKVFPKWSSFDMTTPEMKARMKSLNGRLAAAFAGQVYATPVVPPPPPSVAREQLKPACDAADALAAALKALM